MTNDPWYQSDSDDGGIPDEWVWERLRIRRDALLVASDWTQTIDAPVDQKAWAAYRQELRDLPGLSADPRLVVWPSAPES